MERVRWEDYKGKKILVIDYSELKAIKPEEKKCILDTIEKAIEVSASKKGGKILFLTIAINSQADSDIMDALKGFAKFTADNNLVEKECVVGISSLQKILLSGVNLFSGGKLRPFDTLDQAREWLTS